MSNGTAVVTGAAQGNGAAIAKGMAAAGMKVALADVKQAELASVRDDIVAAGGTAFAAHLDVFDMTAARHFAAEVEKTLGPVSVLSVVRIIGPVDFVL